MHICFLLLVANDVCLWRIWILPFVTVLVDSGFDSLCCAGFSISHHAETCMCAVLAQHHGAGVSLQTLSHPSRQVCTMLNGRVQMTGK